jgi:phosphoglycolate phosphatase
VDKRKFVDQLLDQHGLDASNTFYIGDMVHDVETARHAGLFFVAVLTGYDFEHVLADAKPDLLVPDLGHLHDWLHAWPQAQKMAKF